MLNVQKVM